MKVQRRRTNIRTKAEVVLVDDDEQLGGFRWATVCLSHGWMVAHRTHVLAMAWLSEPWMWCQGCQTWCVVSGTTPPHRPNGRGEMNEPMDLRLQIEDEREEAAAVAWADEQRQAWEAEHGILGHHANDGCDLDDPHDRYHHDTDDDPKVNHHCFHPECRADDLNDERKAGL